MASPLDEPEENPKSTAADAGSKNYRLLELGDAPGCQQKPLRPARNVLREDGAVVFFFLDSSHTTSWDSPLQHYLGFQRWAVSSSMLPHVCSSCSCYSSSRTRSQPPVQISGATSVWQSDNAIIATYIGPEVYR